MFSLTSVTIWKKKALIKSTITDIKVHPRAILLRIFPFSERNWHQGYRRMLKSHLVFYNFHKNMRNIWNGGSRENRTRIECILDHIFA